MTFDLLIQGGHLLDPAAGRDGRFDIAVRAGRIAEVAATIPASAAQTVIDARGLIVLPGLIDLHTHTYYGVTYWGLRADPIAARTGVTTWVDAGSAGAFTLRGFDEFIVRPTPLRMYAFLNISAVGLTAPTGEHHNLPHCDVDLACELVRRYRDLIRGIKARIDYNTVGSNGVVPLQRAREVADRCKLPLMVHIGDGPPSIDDVLTWMRPGDILTHCCTGLNMRLVDAHGSVLEQVVAAVRSGIHLDVGHGAGSFSFATAEALIREGFAPEMISSDVHQLSVNGPLFDLPTCMSKFLALGMSLAEVVRATTIHPARILGLQDNIGTLQPGFLADIALFRLHSGTFPLYDVHMQRRDGRLFLHNVLTIVDGAPLARASDDEPAPWIQLRDEQRLLMQLRHTPADFSA
jgi:dihydroorotase